MPTNTVSESPLITPLAILIKPLPIPNSPMVRQNNLHRLSRKELLSYSHCCVIIRMENLHEHDNK